MAAYSWYLNRPVFHVNARESKWGDMEYEHRNWYSFLWLCGDQMVEQHFHNLDTINWVMGTHPPRSRLDLMPKAFDLSMKMEAPPLPVPGVYKFI